MDINSFAALFVESKAFMPLNEAVRYIHVLGQEEYPMLPKIWKINRHEYVARLAHRSVCEEVEEAFRNASPWEDYREILAELEWPYLYRIARHSMDDIYDKEPNGIKWGEADAWFIEMWIAFHDIFLKFPGYVPDLTQWRMYNMLMRNSCKKLSKYRRNL